MNSPSAQTEGSAQKETLAQQQAPLVPGVPRCRPLDGDGCSVLGHACKAQRVSAEESVKNTTSQSCDKIEIKINENIYSKT